MCGYSVISLEVFDKMEPNLDTILPNNPKVACRKKLYNPISISSKQARW